MSRPEETESLDDMVEAYILVLESTMKIKKTSRKKTPCCQGHKTWFMYSDGWEPRAWRQQYSGNPPEELWIEEHGTGELWIVTGWVTSPENYKKFLSILKPERSGYSRMRAVQLPGKGGSKIWKWGKILTIDNYVETLSHYIHAMKLG